MFTKFLCWAHVRGHVLWTCVSVLENLLLLFLYLLYIYILVFQINIFQFNSIQFFSIQFNGVHTYVSVDSCRIHGEQYLFTLTT